MAACNICSVLNDDSRTDRFPENQPIPCAHIRSPSPQQRDNRDLYIRSLSKLLCCAVHDLVRRDFPPLGNSLRNISKSNMHLDQVRRQPTSIEEAHGLVAVIGSETTRIVSTVEKLTPGRKPHGRVPLGYGTCSKGASEPIPRVLLYNCMQR